jgi:outer membrane immunogenic protein
MFVPRILIVGILCFSTTRVFADEIQPKVIREWGGAFWGLNAGYGWQRHPISFSPYDTDSGRIISVLGFSPPPAINLSDGAFGGQFGYNVVRNRWLAGFETDLNYSTIGGRSDVHTLTPSGVWSGLLWDTSAAQRLKWYGTLRARLGFLATERLLIYGTAGLAFGEMKGRVSSTLYGVASDNSLKLIGIGPLAGTSISCPAGPCAVGSESQIRAGFTMGGGVEWAAWDRLSIKFEYLYMNFGDETITTRFLVSTAANSPGIRTKFGSGVINIVRLGVNLKY